MHNYINIDEILNSKLSFEAYFILYCVYYNYENLINKYIKECKKINTEVFESLKLKGFLNIIDPEQTNNIYFELLSLTEKGRILIESNKVKNEDLIRLGLPSLLKIPKVIIPEESENNFEKFRKFYPIVVRSGFKTRRLHGNLKRCKSLYEKLLMETTHNILCECARSYYKEKQISGDELYIQNLETWLFQKTYLLYLSEVDQLEYNKQDNQSEDI